MNSPLVCECYNNMAYPCYGSKHGKCYSNRNLFSKDHEEVLRRPKDMEGQTLKDGTKKDEGKARWDLLPFEVINAIARILTKGAIKYESRNWEKGILYGRIYAGVMRHLAEWWSCKLFGRDGINHADGEESHLDHAITGLMFLSAYTKRNMEKFDDRPFLNGSK